MEGAATFVTGAGELSCGAGHEPAGVALPPGVDDGCEDGAPEGPPKRFRAAMIAMDWVTANNRNKACNSVPSIICDAVPQRWQAEKECTGHRRQSHTVRRHTVKRQQGRAVFGRSGRRAVMVTIFAAASNLGEQRTTFPPSLGVGPSPCCTPWPTRPAALRLSPCSTPRSGRPAAPPRCR